LETDGVPIFVSGAVEGPSDEAVLRRIVDTRGAEIHRVQVQNGKANLRRALPGYNAAAERDPWLVLVDLDQDFNCAPTLVQDWLPDRGRYMAFRVAVRQIEAWLMADRLRFAAFFSVKGRVPDDPDHLLDAKEQLLQAIRRSRRRAIRDDMLPREGSGRRVGAAYVSRLIEFVNDPERGWRPDEAAGQSPSLARCLQRLDELIASCS
jgi:hypothetical protein